MCCDRSPATFLQRYNFPSEQAWQQYPLYVVVALAIRRDFARYAPPPRTNANEQAKYPKRLPSPLLRDISTPHEGAGSCTFAEIDYLCSG